MRLGYPLVLAAALAACATTPSIGLEAEFAEAAANCGLPTAQLVRDPADPKLLGLSFPAPVAVGEGSLACLTHWARERGYRLEAGTTPTSDRA